MAPGLGARFAARGPLGALQGCSRGRPKVSSYYCQVSRDRLPSPHIWSSTPETFGYKLSVRDWEEGYARGFEEPRALVACPRRLMPPGSSPTLGPWYDLLAPSCRPCICREVNIQSSSTSDQTTRLKDLVLIFRRISTDSGRRVLYSLSLLDHTSSFPSRTRALILMSHL
jgi:hypothetical protein